MKNTRRVHLFTPNTKEYAGSYDAQESPLEEGVFLVPEDSTTAAVPATLSDETATFNGTSWDVVKDYRGTQYWVGDVMSVISVLGEVPPIGSTSTPPPPTAAELAERARKEEIETSSRGDTLLVQLSKMDKDEYTAWWTANITDWQSFKPLAKKLVRLLIHKLL